MLAWFRGRAPSDADVAERAARLKKLQAEIDLLELQLSPAGRRVARLQTLGGIAGFASALVAAAALMMSTWQWTRAERDEHIKRQEDKFDAALTRMGSERETGRLSGVLALSAYIESDPNNAPRALTALANMLAVEHSPALRRAIVTRFETLDLRTLPPDALSASVQALADVSRSLVAEGNLWQSRQHDVLFPSVDSSSFEARAISVRDGLMALMRMGTKPENLARTYLARGDFRRMNLDGVSFDDAILALAKFDDSSLQGASFANADLEYTSFQRANLKMSLFTQAPASHEHQNYVTNQIKRRLNQVTQPDAVGRINVSGPGFDCADLTAADFTGHALVAIFDPKVGGHVAPAMDFGRAKVDGANFTKPGLYGVISETTDVYTYSQDTVIVEETKNDWFVISGRISEDAKIPSSPSDDQIRAVVGHLFHGQGWRRANFSSSFRMLLEENQAQRVAEPCPRSSN